MLSDENIFIAFCLLHPILQTLTENFTFGTDWFFFYIFGTSFFLNKRLDFLLFKMCTLSKEIKVFFLFFAGIYLKLSTAINFNSSISLPLINNHNRKRIPQIGKKWKNELKKIKTNPIIKIWKKTKRITWNASTIFSFQFNSAAHLVSMIAV